MSKYKSMPINELKEAIKAALGISNNTRVSARTRRIAKRKADEMQSYLAKITKPTYLDEISKHKKEKDNINNVSVGCNMQDHEQSTTPELPADTNEEVGINYIIRVFSIYFRDILKSKWINSAKIEAEAIASQAVTKDEFGRTFNQYDVDDFLPDIIRSKLFNPDGSYQPGRVQFSKCVALLCAYCKKTKVPPELVTRAIFYTKQGKLSKAEESLFSMIREKAIDELKK